MAKSMTRVLKSSLISRSGSPTKQGQIRLLPLTTFYPMLAPLSLCLLLAAVISTQAVNVYLSPPRTHLRSAMSPEYASATLSRHLGLEVFEPFHEASHLAFDDTHFIGQGEKNAIVITVEESYVSSKSFSIMVLPV
jgi:hypothetical protein